MNPKIFVFSVLAIAIQIVLFASISCEKSNIYAGDQNPDGGPDGDSDSDSDGDDDEIDPDCDEDCQDFPEDPIIDGHVPSNPDEYFGDPDNFTEPGPCIMEPQVSEGDRPGALFPQNWLRPRFKFVPAGGTDLFEIRLQAEKEEHDLVVYTMNTTWAMPEEIWLATAAAVIGEPITVTVRGVNTSNPGTPNGQRGDFMIAPVQALGKMVYWATTSSEVQLNTSWLSGFAVGDESVIQALNIEEVGDRDILTPDGRDRRPADATIGSGEGSAQCIGCHVATPDGEAVAFGDHWPWNVIVASIQDPLESTVDPGDAPPYLTKGAERLLNQPWLGMPTFSEAYWTDTERLLVTTYRYPRNIQVQLEGESPFTIDVGFNGYSPPEDGSVLAWFDLLTDRDLEIPSDYNGDNMHIRNKLVDDAFEDGFGLIELNGENLSVCSPSWSNDGQSIVYTAATRTQDGRLSDNQNDVDIHMVSFNNGQGGSVSDLQGACDQSSAEYYPVFSPDDKLIAYNREENFKQDKTVTTSFPSPDDVIQISGNGMVYYRPHAEVFVIPSEGGTPIRLAANDPPTCTGESSPGIINSWPKWSPEVLDGSTKRYYWLVFSSARTYEEQFIVPKTMYSPPDTRSSQLYVAAVIQDKETGEFETFPAVYIWNQEKHSSNLTPAWDNFQIPEVPPVLSPPTGDGQVK